MRSAKQRDWTRFSSVLLNACPIIFLSSCSPLGSLAVATRWRHKQALICKITVLARLLQFRGNHGVPKASPKCHQFVLWR
mmetsp:Transcript_80970/g.127493  ORF Transcript_80970/g.127493 Transcript_80970/m.127493 type:complete len:80 (-) Transcript_80970:175-414(-)